MGCARLLVAALLCATLVEGVYLPHTGSDGTLPRTPPGFDIKVLGSLATSSHNQQLPVIVFLHAMHEEHAAERIEWFQRLVDEEGLTFVLPIASLRFIETKQQRIRSWYDFRGALRTPKNLIGYEESFRFIAEIVRSLQRVNRPIYLAGYGQGASLPLVIFRGLLTFLKGVR
jgi:hypothetical protein